MKKTQDLRTERKKTKYEEQDTENKGKVASLQDELDQQSLVREIAARVDGSRLPVEDIKGGGVADPLSATIFNSVPIVYGIHISESRTRSEGPRVDVVELVP